MVSINQLTLGFLILQIYVSAAPSETADKEVTSPAEKDGPKLDDESAPNSPTELNEDNSTQNQRQKRYYSSAFASVNPYYPSYNRRDVSQDIGNYGVDDPLTQIHRHLLQIASVARQPPPPPSPPVNFPFWLPVFYIPQSGCNCKPNKQPQPTPRPDQNTTGNPGVETRFPELEDERLNWGIVNNDNNYDYDLEEDFSRPISFDPITVNTPMKRPPPPVEHGTTQGNQIGPQGTTTARPRPIPPKNDAPQNTPITGGAPFGAPYPTNFSPAERPTTCDASILSCCHQAQVSFSCFSQQGCPDPSRYSQRTNPCDPNTILNIVEKYQKYYGQRNG